VLSSRLVRWLRIGSLGPPGPVSDRAKLLVFGARFTDELLSGAWTVLTPTFRAAFGLSLVGLGALSQAMNWVALGVEPFTATLIDVSSRRRLIGLGSGALAVSLALMGSAQSFWWLLGGFVVYGVGSGPLAHTADVVVVEAYPEGPQRAYARATFFDTVGALAGPGVIAVLTAAGVSWRWGLLGMAVWAAGYAAAAWGTALPPPPRRRRPGRRLLVEAATGVRMTLANPATRRPLAVLLAFEVYEAAFVLKYVWLHATVHLSQAEVAAWALAEHLTGLLGLLALDRWLRVHPPRRLFAVASAALVVLPAAWVASPGLQGKIAVGIPLAFAQSLVWPLAKADSLVAEPNSAGAVQAVAALFGLVPLTLAEAALAEVVGMGPALAGTATLGALAMLAASRRRSSVDAPPAPGGRFTDRSPNRGHVDPEGVQ
jgi:MFS family permease